MTDTSGARPSLEGLEERWAHRWQEEGTYAFDRSKERSDVYAIDTPPPTVSGNLHLGHVFSYTHTDIVARYQRMRGRTVFYPIGFDDNGLPTERRVQLRFGVRVGVDCSRQRFLELCEQQVTEDEEAYERLFRRLGLSVDWAYRYRTIDPVAQTAAQRAFLRNLARGEAYTAEAPTLWDVGMQTAVAQAEIEDREQAGFMHRLRFGPFEIETTRPELLPACVALVCHPSDTRYAGLVGSVVRTPVFGAEVPVHAHPLAEPAKGTGIAMICTFGDLTDVTWWRDLALDTRVIIERDGRLRTEAPSGVDASAYAAVAGLPVAAARTSVVELLRASGDLMGEPRPITHPVKYYEKGDAPLEIVATRQWYIRNGGRNARLREDLVKLGRELRWVPEHMWHRYEHWVGGLTGDWLISRQRYLGVRFPVWYPLTVDGEPDYDRPLAPDEARLPLDPSVAVPDGYTEEQRDRPGGFTADPDVLDTWATSSLSPQIAGGWERDPDLFARVYPMDIRPQAHEIIRTWLFASVVRSLAEHGGLPWHTAVISGWILDPDRKKMGKSVGNAMTPLGILDQYGSDAVRYWAAGGRPGVDLTFDPGRLKVGRRLATKLLNACRFVLSFPDDGVVTEPLDRSMLAALSTVVDAATAALDGYDHTAALVATEAFFWTFCDDYIELVKDRAYGEGPGAASARAALHRALDVQLRLFAPVLPFVTEEIWSWRATGSVHRSRWPVVAELEPAGDSALLRAAGEVLSQIRRAKSERRLSMRAGVALATVRGPVPVLEIVSNAEPDLRAAGRIVKLDLDPGGADELTVICEF